MLLLLLMLLQQQLWMASLCLLLHEGFKTRSLPSGPTQPLSPSVGQNEAEKHGLGAPSGSPSLPEDLPLSSHHLVGKVSPRRVEGLRWPTLPAS